MIGKDFEFCDKKLSDFQMMMANTDEEDSSGLTREILKGGMTMFKKTPNHFGAKYTDVITLNFFIVKNECAADNKVLKSYKLNDTEYRKINAWLSSNQTPKPLKVITNNGDIIEYYGIFTSITPYIFNGVNGLKMIFTCDSPFGYDTQKFGVNSNSSETPIKYQFYNDTDEDDYVYPIISIKPSESGTYAISNVTEGKTMSLELSNEYSEYIIDCGLNRILADGNVLTLADVGWNIQSIVDFNEVNTGMFTAYWLRLLPRENKLEFVGKGKFKVECRIPVKIGGYVNV